MKEDIHGYQRLNTGKLEFLYREGEIRQIRYAGVQVLSSVYGALRDRNWGTVAFRVREEHVAHEDGNLHIHLLQEFDRDEIHYQVRINISVFQDEIHYSYHGKAHSSFLRNRIGLCVLHPASECRGRGLKIRHPDGNTSTGRFPGQISADQPFQDIAGMQWNPSEELNARLDFSGEIFEMEDQRNWTDASYKTYCTPLSLPFPARVESGDEVEQSVHLRIESSSKSPVPQLEKERMLTVYPDTVASLPRIGSLLNMEESPLSSSETEGIKGLGLARFRADLDLNRSDWQDTYDHIAHAQHSLGIPLQLALHLPGDYAENAEAVLELYRKHPLELDSVLLFDEQHLSREAFLKQVLPILRGDLPGHLLGGGTDAYFAELNRNLPVHGLLDFISYSICPQVHAFDNISLLENAAIQGETVRSARNLVSTPLQIGAISLRQRFNVVATEEQLASPESDMRQHTNFAAAWTLVSIRELALSGTEAVNYFELAGPRGIINRDPVPSGTDFPLHELFSEILEAPGSMVLQSASSHPLEFDALVLQNQAVRKVILGNLTDKEISLSFEGLENAPALLDLHPGIHILETSIPTRP